jgi:putative FmdB family regulatory protein
MTAGFDMPLYEYACKACDREFEVLVRSHEMPGCPSCGSTDLERLLSVFAAHTDGASPAADAPAGPCGRCGDPRGPGACSMN